MRVLDACAAPGGKAAHLLETAIIELTALDADAQRAARIGDNLRRLGLAATLKVGDARDVAAWWDGRPYDRILADVPCSASGVVRRHPDAKWLRRESDIAGFAATQKAIVDALWRTLAPGGKMLYATCSVFEEENARQVEAFVGRHADARHLAMPIDAQPQHLPDAEHDGFYYALLQKD
jgi:16S rRNA (cytosine967-C5)-methyltransferase